MAAQVRKITLSASRDIPLNQLVLSQTNVRRTKTGVSIEDLAEDIARRGLLQSLNVRAVVGADGQETGKFEIPAGGRRFRALQLLVKQKRLAKDAPIPCVVRTDGIAEEDSLAENSQRVALHPLDQFRAFQTLVEKGLGEEEIAARFFVTPAVVRQRLRLAAVSPNLLDTYAEDGMTLEQLMAFTVTTDHVSQQRVWDAVSRSGRVDAYYIRRHLTQGAVQASDRRARYVGVDAYIQAGGTVLRDLFSQADDAWLQDPVLLDQLAMEKLQQAADPIRDEGWKWVAVDFTFPYGHSAGLRRLAGETVPLSPDVQTRKDDLQARRDAWLSQHGEDPDVTEDVLEQFEQLERDLGALSRQPLVYAPDERVRGGVFLSLDSDGVPHIDRGYVRLEDEPTVTVDDQGNGQGDDDGRAGEHAANDDGDKPSVAPIVERAITVGGGQPSEPDENEEESLRPLCEQLVRELTTHRTVALRDALANDPDTAHLAVLHVLCLQTFYRFYSSSGHSCLCINATDLPFTSQPPGLAETASAVAINARHKQWENQLPKRAEDLWQVLSQFDRVNRDALFAHCAAFTVSVVEDNTIRRASRLIHSDQLATAVNLDMAAAGWRPSVEAYLGRVSKARILEAVAEAYGQRAADRIEHLKKPEMAKEAERLLAGTGWLPQPLRGQVLPMTALAPNDTTTPEPLPSLPAFLTDEDGTTTPTYAAAAE